MYHWILSNPQLAHHYGVGRTLHAEAVSRHSYQAVRALGRLPDLVTAAVVGLVRGWRAWRDRRRSIAALRALDDRMLSDIGMHRSEIPAVVRAAEQAESRGEQRRGHDTLQPIRPAPADRVGIANDNPTPDLARAACG